ncbi:unnamed protein product, partial [Mesorhabditis belari]|uniref:Uncharacterized protein n=1 Tax=Mesorhabditis belari TaxID=2138241 RepID=A0AAF3J5R2_9BILA
MMAVKDVKPRKSESKTRKRAKTNPRKMIKDLKENDPNKQSSAAGIQNLFQDHLKFFCPVFFAFTKPENQERHRSQEVFLLDSSRVQLREWPHDYIHASWVDGFEKKRQYIASATPHNASMVAAFWRMCVQEKIEVIALLMKPDDEDATLLTTTTKAGDYNVEIETKAEKSFDVLSVSISGKAKHSLKILALNGWTVDEKPPLDVFEKLREAIVENNPSEGPFIISCKHGIFRTGLFLLYDIEYKELAKKNTIRIYDVIQDLRLQRVQFFESRKCFDLIYDVSVEACKKFIDA